MRRGLTGPSAEAIDTVAGGWFPLPLRAFDGWHGGHGLRTGKRAASLQAAANSGFRDQAVWQRITGAGVVERHMVFSGSSRNRSLNHPGHDRLQRQGK